MESRRARWGSSKSKSPRRVLFAVGCYFFLAGIMQSLVSLGGVEANVPTWELGLMLGLTSGGIGVFTDLGFAAYADRGHVWVAVRLGVYLAGSAALSLAFYTPWTLLVGAALFGLGSSAMSNPLLAWLSMSPSKRSQAGVQGLNGTVQRGGALLAAGIVAVGVAVRSPTILALSALVVAPLAFLVLRGSAPRSTRADAPLDDAAGVIRVAWLSYASALRMLQTRSLVVATLLSIAINVILLSTNSYIPLVGNGHRAVAVAGALVARDVCAIFVGLVIARREWKVVSASVIGAGIALAGASVWLTSSLSDGIGLVACTAVQGGVLAMCIAGTNLLTIGAVNPERRAAGMAVTNLPGRLVVFGLPLAGSEILRSAGLGDVFRLIGGLLGVVAVAVVYVGRDPRARLS